ncbi:phosphoribosyltransferase (plasmid) [Chryseobacterium sp. JJR-5R]|uniref:phosphoribosyltransferase n=1 Tax=Chryseobacterium sp. JJR-5R TaxID=3093923 RepID=UPI002A765BD9|nr:phosphoribosyltransferase [Chryseobacterium sp. JJR-5R]WPO84600.1 phosphoribosyltransferase [Chryseobacterium sp. JJR-5R]
MSFEFMTLLIYTPRGDSANAQKSRRLAGACKNGEFPFALKIADKIEELNAGNYFDNSVLVPIPRSTPLVAGAVYPAKTLAEGLLKYGFGNSLQSILKRTQPINKSSNNFTAETRNTVQTHLDSMKVRPLLITEPTIVLIDDILTLGRTAMASAMKLQDVYPDKEIKIFCPFRTRGWEDKNLLVSLESGYMNLSNDGNGVRLPD